MSDDQDDLLNFEIADGDYADGHLNEDELLLSDEDRDEFEEEEQSTPIELSLSTTDLLEPAPQCKEASDDLLPITDASDTGQTTELKAEGNTPAPLISQKEIPVPLIEHPLQLHAPRPSFRPKFQRWPNQQQPPRWNNVPPQQQMPFHRGPLLRPPGHNMQGPQRQMRPGFHPRPPFFNNNFMQSRGPIRPPMVRQRFFYQNQQPIGDPSMQGPGYVPAPIMGGSNSAAPAMPRRVLINPNFKGGVEAAKSQLMKEQFFSSATAIPEDELLRKQQEFINHNMRQIEKRRYERTPSPEYRRGYSQSPPRRRRSFKAYDRRRDFGGANEGKGKDENQPEEDEETRAYRQQIESQAKKREEILRQKEMRRRQQAEQKVKEIQPVETLQPILVIDKKIVLKRKTPERSTTPPIKDAPITPTRRIVLKHSKEGKGVVEVKPVLADGSKRKIQKILKSKDQF